MLPCLLCSDLQTFSSFSFDGFSSVLRSFFTSFNRITRFLVLLQSSPFISNISILLSFIRVLPGLTQVTLEPGDLFRTLYRSVLVEVEVVVVIFVRLGLLCGFLGLLGRLLILILVVLILVVVFVLVLVLGGLLGL